MENISIELALNAERKEIRFFYQFGFGHLICMLSFVVLVLWLSLRFSISNGRGLSAVGFIRSSTQRGFRSSCY